jgi:phosphatidylinositol alpha-1,6-mannosyltransferase
VRTAASVPAHVLLVTEVFPPQVGGSGVLLANVYSRLHSRVTVLTNGVGPPAADHPPSLEVIYRPIAWRSWGIVQPPAFRHYRRVAAEIRALSEAAPTVVHCGRALPEGLAARLSAPLRGRPFVCWAHGEEIEYASQSRELSFVMKRVYSAARAVIANSRQTAQRLEDIGVPPRKIHVVYPGVDTRRFTPDCDGSLVRRRFAAGSELLLLSVGRLQRRKGHDLVLFALAQLRESHPHLRYVIVGDGEERARLERLVAANGLADRVWFVGTIPDPELPAYYTACDIFVLPNRTDGDTEGFGIVFLEAAAAARPVIGGRSGGVPEAVEHGRTGLLVSGTDVHELAAAIRLLAGSMRARQAMGRNGRERVLSAFSWERAAASIEALHHEFTFGR